jgi:hypothetical protein
MTWIIPIIALLAGLIYFAIRIKRDTKRDSCASCPFSDACPINPEKKGESES